MDKAWHPYVDRAAQALTRLGLMTYAAVHPNPTAGGEPHVELVIQNRGIEQRFPVRLRLRLNAADLGALAAGANGPDPQPIYVTEQVDPALADQLKDAGITFVDTAGNAYLNTERLFLFIRGQGVGRAAGEVGGGLPENKKYRGIAKLAATTDEPPDFETHRRTKTGRALEPAGLKLLFVLLTDPAVLQRPYREIAKRAGIAHGTVGWAMPDLERRGFVLVLPGKGKQPTRKLVQVERLLPQWVEAYGRALRPKLLLARYRATHALRPLDDLRLQPGMQWGGEVAAARLTGYLKPATATLWTDRIDPRFVLENRLILDPVGPIEVLQRFWKEDVPQEAATVPLLLVYADLVAIGDARALETAELLKGRVHDRLVGPG